MAAVKVSIPMQQQILELHGKGEKERKIARLLKVSRSTVKKVIARGAVVQPGSAEPDWSRKIDWEQIKLEAGKGVQMNTLWRENASELISYVQFWRQFQKKYPSLPTATMRLEHPPGERSYFDYCDGIDIVCRDTGEVKKTSLMCGVMAMSSYTYAEFTWTQKRDDLTRAMENSFRYFGGVTPYVTVDNQKAAVTTAHWYDPDVNPTFVDFANHWGFAVIPARPVKPRDKGANESGIGVIQRQFFQEVRNRQFYSLEELNAALKEYLNRLNSDVMKDWGLSRNDRFEGERSLLQPCPVANWEQSEWRKAKVHADCHIQVLKKFYSVPFMLVGRELRVRVTAKLIEVFDEDLKPVAAHARLHGKETHSTDVSHYPPEKVAVTQFSVSSAIKAAEKVGPETTQLISEILSGPHPLRYLRRAQGILRLHQSGRVTKEALEHAARQATAFRRPQYPFVQMVAEHYDKVGLRPALVRLAPRRDQSQVYLHQTNEERVDDE